MAILAGSKWSCMLMRIVLHDALSEVTQIYLPASKIDGVCGWTVLQGNHLLQVSGREVSGMQQERRSCFGDECRNVGRGLREREPSSFGRRRKRKKKVCDVRFSLIRKNSGLPYKIHEDSCEEVAEDGKPLASRPQRGCSWRRQLAAAVGKKQFVSLSLFIGRKYPG